MWFQTEENPFRHKYTQTDSHSSINLTFSLPFPNHQTGTPWKTQPIGHDTTQHNRGPNNALRNGSTVVDFHILNNITQTLLLQVFIF